MPTESHTIINVAKRYTSKVFGKPRDNYQHFFRVEITGQPQFNGYREVIKALRERFPAPDYRVDASHADVSYRALDDNGEIIKCS